MCRINNDSIHTCLHECFHAFESVGCHTHTSSYSQTSLGILAGIGLILCLCDVLVSDESYKFIVGIDNRKFLDFMFKKDARCTLKVSLLVSDHKIILCHHIINLLGEVCLETEVTVRHNTYKRIDIIHHWNTTNMILLHDSQRIFHRRTAFDGDWVVNHTIFCTFYNCHLTSLILNGHIFMNYTNTSLTGNGNRHRSLSDCIHGSSHEGNLQFYVT